MAAEERMRGSACGDAGEDIGAIERKNSGDKFRGQFGDSEVDDTFRIAHRTCKSLEFRAQDARFA
jgi:hypothetical protein